jgi:hypothetical protein
MGKLNALQVDKCRWSTGYTKKKNSNTGIPCTSCDLRRTTFLAGYHGGSSGDTLEPMSLLALGNVHRKNGAKAPSATTAHDVATGHQGVVKAARPVQP